MRYLSCPVPGTFAERMSREWRGTRWCSHPGPSFILLLPITDRPRHVEASLPRKQDKAEEVQRRRSACGEEQGYLLPHLSHLWPQSFQSSFGNVCSLASMAGWQPRRSPGRSPLACFSLLSLWSILLCFSAFGGLSESIHPAAITELPVTTFQFKT